MLPARFHAFRRNSPDSLIEIKLRPLSATNLTRSAGRQDRKLYCPCCNSLTGPQSTHEFADSLPVQGWVILRSGGLVDAGQQVFQVAFSARWVFSSAVTTGRRPSQNRFNTATQATGGLSFGLPDW